MATKRVSLAAAGDGSGSSWANAAAWSNIVAVIAAASTGDTILIEAGKVYPVPATPIFLTKPLNWRGQYQSGADGWPIFESNRQWPWPENGMWTNGGQYVQAVEGKTLFRMQTAGTGSTFTLMAPRHLLYFVEAWAGAPADALTAAFTDCRSFNTASPLFYTATNQKGLADVTATRCEAAHYSLKGIRSFGSVSADRCVFNSRNQLETPSDFSAGIHVQDYVQGVMTTRPTVTVTRSAFIGHGPIYPTTVPPSPAPDPDAYLQGDGVVVEESVIATFTDVIAIGAADRGIDIKCPCQIQRYFERNCGFGVSEHTNGVSCIVSEAYLGAPRRHQDPASTSKIACMEGSGTMIVTHSYIDCIPASPADPSDLTLYSAFKPNTNPAGTQSGQITPFRVGDITLANSTLRRKTGTNESTGLTGTPDNARFAALFGLTAHATTRQALLSGAINNSVTTIPLAAPIADAPASSYVVMIDNEAMTVTAGFQTASLTVTRGVNSTSAASHANAAPVKMAHQLTVKGVNAAGVAGAAGPARSFVGLLPYTGGDSTAPTAPGTPSASVVGLDADTQVALSWAGSTDAVGVVGYVVYIDGVPSAYTAGLSRTISNLVPGTLYSMQIAAWDFTNNRSTLSGATPVTTTGSPPAPATPGTGPSISNIVSPAFGPTWANINWGAGGANVVAYEVYDYGTLVAKTFVSTNFTPAYAKINCVDVVVA